MNRTEKKKAAAAFFEANQAEMWAAIDANPDVESRHGHAQSPGPGSGATGDDGQPTLNDE